MRIFVSIHVLVRPSETEWKRQMDWKVDRRLEGSGKGGCNARWGGGVMP